MNYTSRRRPIRRLRWNQPCLLGLVMYLLGSLYLHAQIGKRGDSASTMPPLENENRHSSPILRQHPHQQQQQRNSMNMTHTSLRNRINPHIETSNTTGAVSSFEKGMSACLLVMDDNHFLIEWLAYHYHVLPLRYLVLASDPRSKTSPEPILQRWQTTQQKTTNLTIVTWHDDDFMNATEIEQAESYVKYHFGADIAPALIRHRARQRLFYYKCMTHMKQQARDWTVLIDSDEFLMVSYPTVHAHGHEAPPISQPGSVLTFLQQELQRSDHNLTTPCVQIPRIRFGGQESTPQEVHANNVVPPRSGLDAMKFLTLRWRYHANVNDYGVNKISKVMVDLSRVAWHDLQPVDSIHRPIKSLCGHRRLHIRKPQQVFVINHYLGTWEQYVYRSDAREGNERSMQHFQKSNRVNYTTDDDIRPWLQGFVQDLGLSTAQALLRNVGELEPSS